MDAGKARVKSGRRRAVVVTGTLVAIGLCLVFGYRSLRPSPEDAWHRFLTSTNLAEDQLMDPLIMAGADVLPIVIEQVSNPELPGRRYAITFLGHQSCQQAVPTLERILMSDAEADIFRGDCLQSLAMIDPDLGNRYAQRFAEQDGYLGQRARELLADSDTLPPRRTYWDALFGRHD